MNRHSYTSIQTTWHFLVEFLANKESRSAQFTHSEEVLTRGDIIAIEEQVAQLAATMQIDFLFYNYQHFDKTVFIRV